MSKKWDRIIHQMTGPLKPGLDLFPLHIETLGRTGMNIVQGDQFDRSISLNREGAFELKKYLEKFLACEKTGCQIYVPHEHCPCCGETVPVGFSKAGYPKVGE